MIMADNKLAKSDEDMYRSSLNTSLRTPAVLHQNKVLYRDSDSAFINTINKLVYFCYLMELTFMLL